MPPSRHSALRNPSPPPASARIIPPTSPLRARPHRIPPSSPQNVPSSTSSSSSGFRLPPFIPPPPSTSSRIGPALPAVVPAASSSRAFAIPPFVPVAPPNRTVPPPSYDRPIKKRNRDAPTSSKPSVKRKKKDKSPAIEPPPPPQPHPSFASPPTAPVPNPGPVVGGGGGGGGDGGDGGDDGGGGGGDDWVDQGEERRARSLGLYVARLRSPDAMFAKVGGRVWVMQGWDEKKSTLKPFSYSHLEPSLDDTDVACDCPLLKNSLDEPKVCIHTHLFRNQPVFFADRTWEGNDITLLGLDSNAELQVLASLPKLFVKDTTRSRRPGSSGRRRRR
ncbi:hypothetical protein BDY24DRAFT_376931 [Mrakia frigida]|uniref:uncharacterized protein n=1 Tax=Mrakia frigida TaxID=29902 RepID=UPI003FCC16B1